MKRPKEAELEASRKRKAPMPFRRGKPVRDPNKPKRPTCSFFIFMEEFRKEFIETNPESKTVAAVGKAGGIKWNSMSEAEKAPYLDKARLQMKEYTKKMDVYHNALAKEPIRSLGTSSEKRWSFTLDEEEDEEEDEEDEEEDEEEQDEEDDEEDEEEQEKEDEEEDEEEQDEDDEEEGEEEQLESSDKSESESEDVDDEEVKIDSTLSMDASQSQKSRVDIHINHDYISNLPADVKEKILVKLPMKEMVKTSILSSKWIDSWISIPDLVFNEKCSKSEFIKLVDMVLTIHQGPIEKFKLVSDHACNEAIDRWLLILSKHGIKDLELKYDKEKCKIPFRRISCLQLERLCLSGCSINVPPFFQGFKLLRSLVVSKFDPSGISIENMVLSCPLLDNLGLSNFVQQGCLRIVAPNLTSLDILGEFHDICLETPKLASGSIYLVCTTGASLEFIVKNRKGSNITRALGCLSNIKKLEICREFCHYLAIGPVPDDTPAIFNELTEIRLHLFIFPKEIAVARCLFENSPNLEVLHIEFWGYGTIDPPNVEGLWETKAIQDCFFKRLKVVNIMYAHNQKLSLQSTKSILEFAKLVLSIAPVLEKLSFAGFQEAMVIFEMLKSLRKLSVNAEIVFVPIP